MLMFHHVFIESRWNFTLQTTLDQNLTLKQPASFFSFSASWSISFADLEDLSIVSWVMALTFVTPALFSRNVFRLEQDKSPNFLAGVLTMPWAFMHKEPLPVVGLSNLFFVARSTSEGYKSLSWRFVFLSAGVQSRSRLQWISSAFNSRESLLPSPALICLELSLSWLSPSFSFLIFIWIPVPTIINYILINKNPKCVTNAVKG